MLVSRLRHGAGATPLPDRTLSNGHCRGHAPARHTYFSVETSWSFALQALLCSPGHVSVSPRVSAPVCRRNHRPACLRDGVGASRVFALIVAPFSRHVDRHVYRQVYRRGDLAINMAVQSALNEGLRAGVARGPGPRQGQAGRRERRHPAEASPLGQVRVCTTRFGPFTVVAWERQASTRGAPSGTRCPAGRGGPGPFTPLRCPGLDERSSAVTNPQKSPRFWTRPRAAGRGLNFWGLVTAHSRSPRQRSSPTREATLGLGLTSARPGGRSVGLAGARHIVWGR